jgi:hypothetical protein
MARFGCEECWPDVAEQAWAARGRLKSLDFIVDDTHLLVRFLACEGCGQKFLSIMTETIDWADGDDPQHWVSMPVTLAETLTLGPTDEAGLRQALGDFGNERRSLHRDSPKGSAATSYWATGISICLTTEGERATVTLYATLGLPLEWTRRFIQCHRNPVPPRKPMRA